MRTGQRDLRLYAPIYVIFIVIYLLSCFLEANFFTWNNNVNLFTRITPLVFASMAQTLVILTGGIDLSIGSIIGLTNVLAASLPYPESGLNVVLWFLVPALAGLALGLINGLIITGGGFSPLIVTLATGAIWKGLSLFIMPVPGGEVSLAVARTATGKLGAVPMPLLIFLAGALACHRLLTRTRFGRSIYALGGNETLAYESGIACGRVKIWVYGTAGLLAALAGMFLSARMFSGDPLAGEPYILNSIAVAVIAGTSLAGGRGGVAGIIGGAYVFLLINNILNLLAISSFYQYVAKGLILIIALAITSSGGEISPAAWMRRLLKPAGAPSGGVDGPG